MIKGKQLYCLLFAWFLFLIANPFAAKAQTDTWVTSFGSVVDDYPEEIMVDPMGNIYVTGFFRDTMQIGGQQLISAGKSDIFIAKFDPMGQLTWAERFGWFENDIMHSMALDTFGNLYLVGEFQDSTLIGNDTLFTEDTTWNGPYAHTYDALTLRLNSNGNLLDYWYGGWFGTENLYDVVVHPVKNTAFISGMYRTYNNWALNGQFWTAGHGRGFDDAIWIETDANDSILYRGVAKGTFIDKGKAVGILEDTLVVMGGTFQDTCFFIDSVYYELGDFENDVFIATYQNDGTFDWVVTGASKGVDDLSALVIDAQDNIYFVGSFDSSFTIGGMTIDGNANVDGYVGKMNKNGTMQWLKAIAGQGYDHVQDIQIASNGDLLLTGYFQRELTLGNGVSLTMSDTMDQNAFVIRMDNAGNYLWAKSLGGATIDRGISLQAESNGYIYAMGTFTGLGKFGQTETQSNGGADCYLLKMNADGAVSVANSNQTQLEVNLWPNPTKEQVNIQFTLKKPSSVQIELLDIQGTLKRSQKIDSGKTGINTYLFDLNDLASGLYFLRIDSKEGTAVKKLVLAK